jgi:hypothetical protein
MGDLGEVGTVHSIAVQLPQGPILVPDIRTIGFANRKIIVSCEQTRNLLDLTSLWKKTVLTQLDRDTLEPEETIKMESDSSLSDSSRTDLSYLFRILGYRQTIK